MGHRTVLFGKTAELAIMANLVLIHGSTAASFAILARKPILSLTTTQLDVTSYGLHVRLMSKALGTRLINIDKEDYRKINHRSIKVDDDRYARYVSDYICNKHCKERELWAEFTDYVRVDM